MTLVVQLGTSEGTIKLIPGMRRAELDPVNVEPGGIKPVVYCRGGILSLRLLLTRTSSLCNILQRFCSWFITTEDITFLGNTH